MLDPERQALIEQYGEGVRRLKAALATAPAAALQWRPQAGAWSIHEVVCHCADSETNSASRIRYLTGERELVLDTYDQDRWAIDFDYHAHPFDAALAAVEAVRANTLPLIRRLPAQAWERMHRHKTKGAYTATDWLRTYAGHLHDHAQQIAANIDAWHHRRVPR